MVRRQRPTCEPGRVTTMQWRWRIRDDPIATYTVFSRARERAKRRLRESDRGASRATPDFSEAWPRSFPRTRTTRTRNRWPFGATDSFSHLTLAARLAAYDWKQPRKDEGVRRCEKLRRVGCGGRRKLEVILCRRWRRIGSVMSRIRRCGVDRRGPIGGRKRRAHIRSD